jgi:hypothetical protein
MNRAMGKKATHEDDEEVDTQDLILEVKINFIEFQKIIPRTP